jgi:hypothetical protein
VSLGRQDRGHEGAVVGVGQKGDPPHLGHAPVDHGANGQPVNGGGQRSACRWDGDDEAIPAEHREGRGGVPGSGRTLDAGQVDRMRARPAETTRLDNSASEAGELRGDQLQGPIEERVGGHSAPALSGGQDLGPTSVSSNRCRPASGACARAALSASAGHHVHREPAGRSRGMFSKRSNVHSPSVTGASARYRRRMFWVRGCTSRAARISSGEGAVRWGFRPPGRALLWPSTCCVQSTGRALTGGFVADKRG